MATPSENLENIANTIQDVALYTNATNQSIVGVNGTILNVGQAITSAINSVVTEISTVVSAVVGVSNAISNIPPGQSVDTSRMELLLQGISAKSSISIRSSNSNFSTLIDAVNNQQPQNNNNQKAKSGFADQQKNDFKKIISGFGGGIAGAVASVTVEVKNFIASIQKAYGDGGLIGLVKATAQLTTAFTGIPSAMLSIVKAASPFVTALDPALMAKLGLAFSDLMAVVGYGLRPIIVMAIAAVRMFADMLVPVMREMAPALASMSGAIMQLIVPVLAIWSNSIAQLIPVVESLPGLFRIVGETIAWFSPVISLGFRALAAALNGLISVISAVVGSIKTLMVAVLDMVAWAMSKVPFMGETAKQIEGASKTLADSAGKDFNDAADAFGRMFKEQQVGPVQQGASTGMAAKGASFAGIGDLGKNLMQAAFGSSTEKIQQEQLNAQKDAVGVLNMILGAVAGGGGAKMAGVRN